ncbi:hypothetical protein [Rhodohalobacter sp. 8-1]|uniref:hypothetical protein n=1 Tax=Rhodohalobacter sp. 8-1 TaxID=3131972 RepID=UPI0030EB2B11
MKKLTTLSIALLFSVVSAFAQSNEATATQEVDDSEIIINQAGSSNTAVALQTLGNDKMLIDIDQQGSGNDADVTQQYGQWHEAQIDQVGSGNEVNLTQDNTSTLADVSQEGAGNSADIYQRNYRFEFGTYSSRVDVGQIGDNNEVMVDSDGFGNNVSIEQGSETMASDGQYASVTQNGSDNQATIEQYGRGGADHTQIQDGEGNRAIADSPWGSSDGYQEQTGTGNYSLIKQNGYHSATSKQNGSDNYSWIRQSAGSSDASFTQTGDNNQINADQRGVGSEMTIAQTGNGNTAGTAGFTNMGIFQIGDGNSLELTQTGDNNSAFVDQSGDNHTATISSIGNGNSASITQN